jgi:hypothetical protein
MASPEPAPTGVAGFRDEMPFQPGNRSSTLIPWLTTAVRGRIRIGNHWPLTLDTSQAMSGGAAVCECAPVEFPQPGERRLPDPVPALTLRVPDFTAELDPTPSQDLMAQTSARCDKWMPAPAAEPVAAFVGASADLEPADAPHILSFGTELDPTPCLNLASQTPARRHNWMPVPAPEPVTSFIRASSAPSMRVDTPHVLRFAAELDPTPYLDLTPYTIPACDRWAPIPAPEPVAAFVQASAAPTPVYAPRTLLFTAELEHEPPLDANFAACNLGMPGFAAASACGAPADAPGVERSAAPPQMPASEFNAERELLPILDVPLTPPAMCQRWMPAAAAADPVFLNLRTSMAPSVAVPRAMKAPAFSISAVAPQVARVDQAQPIPSAEEVMAVAATNASTAPPAWIHSAAAMALPAVPPADQELFAAIGQVPTPLPEAVELPPVDTRTSEPVVMPHAPLVNPELGALPEFLEAAPAMGKLVSIPSPAALESVPLAPVAVPVALAAPVRLLPFQEAASQQLRLPEFDAQRLTPEVRKPAKVGPRLVAPEPIATLAVMPPAIGQRQVEPGLPRPGLLPLEYHSQRQRHAPAGRPEWRTPQPALYPPPFLLAPVLEKLEDPALVQKVARPGFGKLRTMPASKRTPRSLMIAGSIAAGFLLAAALWVGVANYRGNRPLIAQEEVPSVDVVPGNRAGAARAPNGGTPAHAATGPVAWIRRTIANRAALKIGDGFRSMDHWDGEAQARPAGWTRHPDGYVKTGALALFHPSLKFTDFRLEFFGQIETKSIGWTVHSTNTMNYHAMKLTVVEAGLRPFVALVHYNVVGGKSGHRTQTPLNIMVHNNRPMQFAVDVRGSSVVTSIDGEEVDSFIDSTLVAGGVGFFSDAGERARLFWMRVSRNDDWLGHVCAMLANGAAEGSTAGLRGPGLPDGAPAPRLPGDGNEMAVAGVWIALPYLRATRKTRFFKTWRSDPWNTQAEATRTACPCHRA